MATRRPAARTIELDVIWKVYVEYWNGMIIFRMFRTIGIPQKYAQVLMVIFSILFLYVVHQVWFGTARVAEGVITGKSDNLLKSLKDGSHFKSNNGLNLDPQKHSAIKPISGGGVGGGSPHHKTRRLLQYADISLDQPLKPSLGRQPVENVGGSRRMMHNNNIPKINQDLDDPHKNLRVKFINNNINDYVHYRNDLPLIWIMGPPRSGSSFLRVLLDAHPDIRCGEETFLINELFNMHKEILKDDAPALQKLEEANINKKVLYNAMGAYILSIITQHGEQAKWLCSKEPKLMLQATNILEMFPKSKFVLMLRDGRAVVQSISRRHLSTPSLSPNPLFHRANLQYWNGMTRDMVDECDSLGPEKCMKVHYERLVLRPKQELLKLLNWLGIPWNDTVLHHELTIGKPGGAKLSNLEPSREELKQPINSQSLYQWAKDFPEQFKDQADYVAPLLRKLGYDPSAYPPNYGKPDKMVAKNTQELQQQIIKDQL